jgi:hypothetical protein
MTILLFRSDQNMRRKRKNLNTIFSKEMDTHTYHAHEAFSAHGQEPLLSLMLLETYACNPAILHQDQADSVGGSQHQGLILI